MNAFRRSAKEIALRGASIGLTSVHTADM